MVAEREAPPGTTRYLLVVEGMSTKVFGLPGSGEVTVGSAGNATFKIEDGRVAAVALRLEVSKGAITAFAADESTVRLNGSLLSGHRVLTFGDVLAVGETSLILHSRTGREAVDTRLDYGHLRSRIAEEIERSRRSHRSLAVLWIDLGEKDARLVRGAREIVEGALRIVDLIGWPGDSEAAALLPETAGTAVVPARRVLDGLRNLAPRASVGIAICPDDAQDADALLAGARLAAAVPPRGRTVMVPEISRTILAGEHGLVVADPAMSSVLSLAERVAGSGLPVLITGETGTGKELVARAIHGWSPRRDRQFVAVNCSAMAETLFENELFGHEAGAYTDARAAKEGIIERADGGTLFLDEIGDLPGRLQPKLLRVLETGMVSRLGSTGETHVDIRIVAATNRDIDAHVAEDAFRRDLYFRLAGARIAVPPLRDRPLDVPVMARALLDDACARVGRAPMCIAPETMRVLGMYSWPGNVRELRNAMELVAATQGAGRLEPADLPQAISGSIPPWFMERASPDRAPVAGEKAASFEERPSSSLRKELAGLERLRIGQALAAAGGVQVRAAELLEMPLRTFISRLKTFGIDPRRYRGPGGENDKG